jgi:hypothetical protein
MFCDGGLFACTVCGGTEGSLPTDCPLVHMTQQQQDDVYKGTTDYRDGRGWVAPDGTGKSIGDMSLRVSKGEFLVEGT